MTILERNQETQQAQIMRYLQEYVDDALTSNVATSPYFLVKTDIPIIAGYCVYRDEEFLRSSLDSICMYVNAIVIFDGRFLDFRELPLDRTYEITCDVASRFDPQWFIGQAMTQKFVYFNTEATYGPMLEVEKRDLMFQVIRDGGFLFIIDGDEIAVGDVKAGFDFVRANPDRKIFWVYVEEEGNPGWKPRIIKVEEGIHYGSNHWTILDKSNAVITNSIWRECAEDSKITQFKIHNFGSKRSGQRGEERVKYRETMRSRNWKEEVVEVEEV